MAQADLLDKYIPQLDSKALGISLPGDAPMSLPVQDPIGRRTSVSDLTNGLSPIISKVKELQNDPAYRKDKEIEAETAGREADIQKQKQERIEQIRAGMKDLPDAPSETFQDPMKAFSSIFPAIALLGATRSRHPAIAAAKAASAAMKAFHKGDKERIDLAVTNWKNQVDKVIKHNSFLKDLQDMDAASFEAAISSAKAEGLQKVLREGGFVEAMNAAMPLIKAQNDLERARALMDRSHKTSPEQQIFYEALQEHPEWGIEEQAAFWGKLKQASKGTAELSDEAARLTAERLLAGDMRATTGLARSSANIIKVDNELAKIVKERGLSVQDLIQAQANFHGIMAEQSQVGRRAGQLAGIGEYTQELVRDTKELSKKVYRGRDFSILSSSINEANLLALRASSDPDEAELAANIYSIASEYSKALNPTGQNTDAGREEAYRILRASQSQEAFNRVLDRIDTNIQKERRVYEKALGKKDTEGTNKTEPSKEDLEYTAKLHNMTVDEVKKQLGM